MLFFIISFLYFPSHIMRIMLFFVYSNDHKTYVIYPSFKKEDLLPSCILDIEPFLSSKSYVNDVGIQILPEHDQPCNHLNDKDDSPPS
jgi:hypothetical protein